MGQRVTVDGLDVVVSGHVRRIAKLRAEYYEYVDDPARFVQSLRAAGVRADIFSFLQETALREPRFPFQYDVESISVLRITDYEHWWKKQLNDKTRNMIRKAQKAGVEVRVANYDDEFVRGIKGVYDESPLRQGKPFAHYGKDLATLEREHASYADRSDFIGAYHQGRMIGFAKLVNRPGVSNLMQIIAMISERDKAPTNALIAKAYELCAQRSVPFLHYGLWSKRGLGDFKRKHCFEQLDVYRYFLPLGLRGRALLAGRLHRRLPQYVPERFEDSLVALRARWNEFRFGTPGR